jgi:hypothetical protein
MKWQPIITVPKDGRKVILWLGGPWSKWVAARWFDHWKVWIEGELPDKDDERYGIGSRIPTHWIPGPESPCESDTWWCSACGKVVSSDQVTYEETHDERSGGCGGAVF